MFVPNENNGPIYEKDPDGQVLYIYTYIYIFIYSVEALLKISLLSPHHGYILSSAHNQPTNTQPGGIIGNFSQGKPIFLSPNNRQESSEEDEDGIFLLLTSRSYCCILSPTFALFSPDFHQTKRDNRY